MSDNPAFGPLARPHGGLRSPQGLSSVLERWRAKHHAAIALDRAFDPIAARKAAFPADLHPGLEQALRARGLTSLYSHQARARELALEGRHLVVATPTASGKSLCYNLPVLESLARDPSARALYLFPTKALSRDQEAALHALAREASLSLGAITYDGDTPGDARRAAREQASILLTNPDMLHAGILPHHASWARFFASLRYVVIDEVHTYRGVFGSHLANVLRRLDRLARFHGSSPVFLMASATIGNPAEHASRLIGREALCIDESGAPVGPRRLLVYNPPIINAELGLRASYLKSAVRFTADLVGAGVSTLLFGQSRNAVEVMLKYLRDRLGPKGPDGHCIDPESIQAYRGGYLPKERREIERRLRSGEIRCVVATNALELGVDIGSLDAVVCAGYPGTIAGTWQRFGRAGRRQGDALALLVTSSAPLDQFVATAPELLTSSAMEQARIDPDNLEILIQHLRCATFELPFEQGERFGDLPEAAADEVLEFLAKNEVVHPSPSRSGRTIYHWASQSYPANGVSLRSASWDNFVIIDLDHDQILGEMDWHSAHTMLHEKAIYQHDATQYQVERLDYDDQKAFVRKVAPDYYTTAMTHTQIAIVEQDQRGDLALSSELVLDAGLGEVSVVQRVVGYKKIKFHTHENVGYGDVHLPEIQMHTSAFWIVFPEHFIASREEPRPLVIDALRGLLKALSLVASFGLMVDPRDIGRTLEDPVDRGRSDGAAIEPEGTGDPSRFHPTLFLYDQVPGGIGLAPRLFEDRDELLRRAKILIDTCPCTAGCPACVGPPVGVDPNAPDKTLVAFGRKALARSLLQTILH